MLKIPTRALILVAAFVWLIAGAFVVSVGVKASEVPWTGGMALGYVIVLVFFLIMFLMIARKHIRRIRGYREEMMNLLKFLDPPSYIILLVMIGIGASVRISGLVPGEIIAFFYSGLGTALIIAAIFYIVTYVAVCEELSTQYASFSEYLDKYR